MLAAWQSGAGLYTSPLLASNSMELVPTWVDGCLHTVDLLLL